MNTTFIRKLVRISLASVCILSVGVQARAEAYFGFAPLNPDPENTSALGSGKNGYTEAAIAIDPSTNPAAAALKGAKILGMRCYVRADYPQMRKKTSAVNVRIGSLTADPVKNYADFFEGWNEIMLDSPVEIGDEPIFIGPMVYETSGTPYPFVTAHGPSFAGGFNVSLSKEPWQVYSQRGNLLMQVIIDKDPEEMPLTAMAALSDIPLVVAPDDRFVCKLAVHNFSGSTLESVTLKTITDNGEIEFEQDVPLPSPLASFDTVTMGIDLPTGHHEDPAVGYTVIVTGVNGAEIAINPEMTYSLHVTQDAFLRIPLVEEFTSQSCTNCPFMMYYIDRAMEQFDRPLVYMTRHSGFVKDKFTIREDTELTYLFGTSATYNPAIMYDRTIFDENSATPVAGASTASVTPYLNALELAAVQPALAKVVVNAETSGASTSCLVRGKIAHGVDLDGLYVCAYLIENNIPRDEVYFQEGIDDAPDDAPDDLAETFSHNGIIRVKFHKDNLGDLLYVDPETREFSIDYGTADVNPEWVIDNCETVAFVCRVNKDDIADNYVLNAGGSRWNGLVENGSGVESILDGKMPFKVTVAPDGRVTIDGDYANADIYTVSGQKLSLSAPLPKGIYVVNVTMRNGSRRSVKIAAL